jgi:hypothetical protein
MMFMLATTELFFEEYREYCFLQLLHQQNIRIYPQKEAGEVRKKYGVPHCGSATSMGSPQFGFYV